MTSCLFSSYQSLQFISMYSFPLKYDYCVLGSCQHLKTIKHREMWEYTRQHHLFSMSVCTLLTKSRAIVRTCGTLCRSAISEKRTIKPF